MKFNHEDIPVPGSNKPVLPDVNPLVSLPMDAQVISEDKEKVEEVTPGIRLSVTTIMSRSIG